LVLLNLFLLSALAPMPQATISARRIEPKDTVEIRCPESAQFCVRRTVSSAGTVDLPEVGAVSVAGKTTAEAGRLISDALRSRTSLRSADVTLTTAAGKSKLVWVDGLVTSPGTVYLGNGMTLQDVLALVKPAAGADLKRVEISTVEGNTILADATSRTWSLHGGDRIHLANAVRRDLVYVAGGVEQPGIVAYEDGMTIAQAVTKAGGVSANGSLRNWRLAHSGAAFVPLPDSPDTSGEKLKPGDIVQVPTTGDPELMTILGAVTQAGTAEFIKGVKLTSLIASAGGTRPDADLGHILVLRQKEPQAIAVDLTTMRAKKQPEFLLQKGDTVIVPFLQVKARP